MFEAFGYFLNNAVNVSILVIVISSLIGFYAKSRSRDRCIADMDGFLVTVEKKDGEVIWGTIRVYPSGIEFIYSKAHQDDQGHVENSYILYNDEMASVQAFYRFHDDQSVSQQRVRTHDIRRTYRPTIFRRVARGLRNTLSTFQDAIIQSLNAILSARAAARPQDVVLSKHKELASSGAQLLGTTLRKTFDPILERYIGQYVVLEILRGDDVEEEYGILKEYTARFVELLNVKVQVPLHVYLKSQRDSEKAVAHFEQQDGTIRVSNTLERTVIVEAVRCKGESRKLNIAVDCRQTIDIPLQESETGAAVELELSVRCLADLVVPHPLAVIRHAGVREKLSLETLLGLDDLYVYPWVKRLLDGKVRFGL